MEEEGNVNYNKGFTDNIDFFRLSGDSRGYLIPINKKSLTESGYLPSRSFPENHGEVLATSNRTEIVYDSSNRLIIKVTEGGANLYSLFKIKDSKTVNPGLAFCSLKNYDISPHRSNESFKDRLSELLNEFDSPNRPTSEVTLKSI